MKKILNLFDNRPMIKKVIDQNLKVAWDVAFEKKNHHGLRFSILDSWLPIPLFVYALTAAIKESIPKHQLQVTHFFIELISPSNWFMAAAKKDIEQLNKSLYTCLNSLKLIHEDGLEKLKILNHKSNGNWQISYVLEYPTYRIIFKKPKNQSTTKDAKALHSLKSIYFIDAPGEMLQAHTFLATKADKFDVLTTPIKENLNDEHLAIHLKLKALMTFFMLVTILSFGKIDPIFFIYLIELIFVKIFGLFFNQINKYDHSSAIILRNESASTIHNTRYYYDLVQTEIGCNTSLLMAMAIKKKMNAQEILSALGIIILDSIISEKFILPYIENKNFNYYLDINIENAIFSIKNIFYLFFPETRNAFNVKRERGFFLEYLNPEISHSFEKSVLLMTIIKSLSLYLPKKSIKIIDLKTGFCQIYVPLTPIIFAHNVSLVNAIIQQIQSSFPAALILYKTIPDIEDTWKLKVLPTNDYTYNFYIKLHKQKIRNKILNKKFSIIKNKDFLLLSLKKDLPYIEEMFFFPEPSEETPQLKNKTSGLDKENKEKENNSTLELKQEPPLEIKKSENILTNHYPISEKKFKKNQFKTRKKFTSRPPKTPISPKFSDISPNSEIKLNRLKNINTVIKEILPIIRQAFLSEIKVLCSFQDDRHDKTSLLFEVFIVMAYAIHQLDPRIHVDCFGGMILSTMLDQKPNDLDIRLRFFHPISIETLFTSLIEKNIIQSYRKSANPIIESYTVSIYNMIVEIMICRTDINEEVYRVDFDCNSMYLNILDFENPSVKITMPLGSRQFMHSMRQGKNPALHFVRHPIYITALNHSSVQQQIKQILLLLCPEENRKISYYLQKMPEDPKIFLKSSGPIVDLIWTILRIIDNPKNIFRTLIKHSSLPCLLPHLTQKLLTNYTTELFNTALLHRNLTDLKTQSDPRIPFFTFVKNYIQKQLNRKKMNEPIIPWWQLCHDILMIGKDTNKTKLYLSEGLQKYSQNFLDKIKKSREATAAIDAFLLLLSLQTCETLLEVTPISLEIFLDHLKIQMAQHAVRYQYQASKVFFAQSTNVLATRWQQRLSIETGQKFFPDNKQALALSCSTF